MPATRPVQSRNATALSALFARYLSGQIPDGSWTQMMSILDHGVSNSEERVALVNFLSDACAAVGAAEVEVPRLSELDDFVSLTHAA